jgi:hypothetical protein
MCKLVLSPKLNDQNSIQTNLLLVLLKFRKIFNCDFCDVIESQFYSSISFLFPFILSRYSSRHRNWNCLCRFDYVIRKKSFLEAATFLLRNSRLCSLGSNGTVLSHDFVPDAFRSVKSFAVKLNYSRIVSRRSIILNLSHPIE